MRQDIGEDAGEVDVPFLSCAALLAACVAPPALDADSPPAVVDTAVLNVVSSETLADLSSGLRAFIHAALTVDRPPLDDVQRRVGTLDPTCAPVEPHASGVRVVASCPFNEVTGERASGVYVWFESEVDESEAANAAWLDRWTPGLGLIPEARTSYVPVFLYGQLMWMDGSGPILRLWGDFSHVEATWPGARLSRTWADGGVDNRLADPAVWTGNDLQTTAFEIGRIHAGDTRVVTIDGMLDGLPGPVVAAQIDGGEWRVSGGACDAEPAGAWGLRHADGRWYDLRFDGPCDGCGQVSSAGLAETAFCLGQADREAITAAVGGVLP